MEASEPEGLVLRGSRQKITYWASRQGLFELRDSAKTRRLVLSPRLGAELRILKTEINRQHYLFTVRVSDSGTSLQFLVEGREALEQLLRLTGRYAYVQGLQDLVSSLKKVGEGAFAQVYEALTHYQSRFGLKAFEKKEMEGCAKNLEAFRNELSIMQSLSSRHLLSYDYVFETEKAYYLRMELLEGSFKQRIAGRLSVRQQKTFMAQLLQALLEMKQKQILHRDLKPDNIMLRITPDGHEEAVIIDFGLATHSDVKEYLFFRCGTPGFLAPEIANLTSKRERQTPAADMFSLGCIFYRMLTGRYLFGGKSAKEVLHNNRKNLYNKDHFGYLSLAQKRLLLRMIDPNPKDRITPEEALRSPYFDPDPDDDDEVPDEECQIEKRLLRLASSLPIKNMDSVNSSAASLSCLDQSGSYRVARPSDLRDSCLTLEMGRGAPSEEDLRTSRLSNSRQLRVSKTPQKVLRQSRFSRMEKDNRSQL